MGLKTFVFGAAVGAMAATLYRDSVGRGGGNGAGDHAGNGNGTNAEPQATASGPATRSTTSTADSPNGAERLQAAQGDAAGGLSQALPQGGQNVHLLGGKRVNTGGNADAADGEMVNTPDPKPDPASDDITPGLPDFSRGA